MDTGITEYEIHTWSNSSLFDLIPLMIAVVGRDYRILSANRRFTEYFGQWQGKKCYEAYMGATAPCPNCAAMETFQDGKPRTYEATGTDVDGDPAHYVVQTVPVVDPGGSVSHVMEMSRNVTDVRLQQREYEILFERVPCYIAVLDRNMHIVRANEKLRETFGECRGKRCHEVYKKRDSVCEECPAIMTFNDGKEHTSTHMGISKDGKETHYAVVTSPLSKGRRSSHVLEILTDITHIKALENEKLEAERLAAVGQTVAGLAHSVKNILMGVEGGMYMVGTGISRDDKVRLTEGWDTLQRNITKVTSLVKDFLSFAKGREPRAQLVDPNRLVDEIVDLYRDTAKELGVHLVRSTARGIYPAPLDPDGIHTCLTNLVSNAIDACTTSSREACKVKMDVHEESGTIIFEVTDEGCGIDYDIRKKVFTTFFTTKGGKGTGLGLLTTRKIVQEHGGKVLVESTPGKGSVFRIELPRHRLPQPTQNPKGV